MGSERLRHVRLRAHTEDTYRAALAGIRVLLVDAEADTREWLAGLLRRSGAGVTAVASASEAFAALTRFRPDVLVADIHLPGEDGFALVRAIRAIDPDIGVDMPAIALTSSCGFNGGEEVFRAGFKVHLPKAIALTQLANVVGHLAVDTGALRGDG